MVGKRIRELREEKEIEREQMVELVGICSTTMSLYESGCRSPKVETVSKLADFFGVGMDYILGRVESRHFNIEEIEGVRQLLFNHPDLVDLLRDYNLWPKAQKEELKEFLESKIKD